MHNKIKVSIIVTGDSITAIGVRTIASYLKQHAHSVKLIFLPTKDKFSNLYDDNIINGIVRLCHDSDLVGISLMTNYFIKARDLTDKLKSKIRAPIIWGGIHPSVKPEECLRHADMVCIGEGEESMLKLANSLKSKDIDNIESIWIKKEGRIIKWLMR